jgi:hypothetical protein
MDKWTVKGIGVGEGKSCWDGVVEKMDGVGEIIGLEMGRIIDSLVIRYIAK